MEGLSMEMGKWKRFVVMGLFAAGLFLGFSTAANAQAAANGEGKYPRVFLIEASRLEQVKRLAEQHDPRVLALIDTLRRRADALLERRPLSVMDKPVAAPSGSKHDYMSQAPYFWYDSSKPNGLPYIRRDGQRNPEILAITDHAYLSDLDNILRQLSLAWYFSHDNKYAGKAALLLKCWFLDTATRMNPNLTYAQAVPGMNDGRGIGIIETIALTGIADAAGLLEDSGVWTAADAVALRKWYRQYLDWMLTSANGKDEHAAKNNHGTWYLVQAVDLALFTGDGQTAKALAAEGKSLLEHQVDGEGKMALELERTNGLSYSSYNLQAWFRLATLAKQTGTDLWNYRNQAGAGIRTALDWLRPYAMGEKKWPYQQITPYNKSDLYSLLLQAFLHYQDASYRTYATALNKKGDVITELLLGID